MAQMIHCQTLAASWTSISDQRPQWKHTILKDWSGRAAGVPPHQCCNIAVSGLHGNACVVAMIRRCDCVCPLLQGPLRVCELRSLSMTSRILVNIRGVSDAFVCGC